MKLSNVLGTSAAYPLLGVYCGTLTTVSASSTANVIYFVAHFDSSVTDIGYNFEFTFNTKRNSFLLIQWNVTLIHE